MHLSLLFMAHVTSVVLILSDDVVLFRRFIFFHAFFDVKKPTSGIPETTRALSVPIDKQTRVSIASAFYRYDRRSV